MPENLFAACRVDGQLVARRVGLAAPVQQQVEDMFDQQEQKFRSGVMEAIPFDGGWNPDADQVLTIPIPQEAGIFHQTIAANAVSIPPIDTGRFVDANIKALFTGVNENDAPKVLVQRFTAGQVLNRKYALLFSDNAFSRLQDPAFVLGTGLACIIEAGVIKFKSLHNLRSIIDITEIYREATDAEVHNFAEHNTLEVADADAFVETSDQTIRKLVHSITDTGVLDKYSAENIRDAAQKTGLTVKVQNGKIVIPADRNGIKALLQFLNESRYAGPLSDQPYIANSRRLA